MTPEEIDHTMQFILEQQAQFATDILQVRDVLGEQSRLLGTQSQAIVSLVGMIGELKDVQSSHEKRLTTLETAMAELAAAGRETQERLNAFIVFVERYISGRDGGKQAPSS